MQTQTMFSPLNLAMGQFTLIPIKDNKLIN